MNTQDYVNRSNRMLQILDRMDEIESEKNHLKYEVRMKDIIQPQLNLLQREHDMLMRELKTL